MVNQPTATSRNLEICSQIERGMSTAKDAANQEAIRGGGRGVTNLHSPWMLSLCPVCHNTFRLGDEVWIDRDGTVRHASSELPCDRGEVHEPQATPLLDRFLEGLDLAWPPPREVPIARLTPGHPLLVAPTPQFPKRRRCAVCRHTFRVHDHVVICPCRPLAPRCLAAVHRDPCHGLSCLDIWDPEANDQQFCPITHEGLDER